MIIDEKVGLFFANLVNNNPRYQSTPYEHVYPRIRLMDKSITLSYCYEADRDGEDWINYVFEDPTVNENLWEPSERIRYSEIPDDIWEIIQSKLYENATKTIDKELKEARSHLKYLEEKKKEFDKWKSC
ncbi:MAG: hypothetical protein J6I84_04530 [Bacilli bacterium]|nr:hypothetical protein [Bacilli bacterium]